MKRWVLLLVLLTAACGTARVEPTLVPTPTPTPATGGWQFSRKTDSFTDKETAWIYVEAEAPLVTLTGSPIPELVVRCKDGKVETFISTGTFVHTDAAYLKYRFDQGEVVETQGSMSTDGTSIFLHQYLGNNPAAEMSGKETFLVGFEPYGESPVEAKFNIHGYDEAVKPVLEACK